MRGEPAQACRCFGNALGTAGKNDRGVTDLSARPRPGTQRFPTSYTLDERPRSYASWATQRTFPFVPIKHLRRVIQPSCSELQIFTTADIIDSSALPTVGRETMETHHHPGADWRHRLGIAVENTGRCHRPKKWRPGRRVANRADDPNSKRRRRQEESKERAGE